jgi:pilus assembly protein CpaF
VTMRDLVRNCLRMRPERIIVGEVRGAEAFDLLQAMNTGHDGSMSTLHANSPREAIGRLEGMILMAGFQLPTQAIRRMITGAVDVIVQVARMRDGRRRVTHITEVVGQEGDIVLTQDLLVFDLHGEDAKGALLGQHRFTGISRPRFTERARYFGLERRLMELLARGEENASALGDED